MNVALNSDRQYPLTAIVDFVYTDFTSGVFLPMFEAPADAIVIGGHLTITTPFDSETSDTFTIGDALDDDEYGAAIDGQAAATTKLVLSGHKYAANTMLGLKLTSVDAAEALSQGAGTLVVTYVRAGRSNENQG